MKSWTVETRATVLRIYHVAGDNEKDAEARTVEAKPAHEPEAKVHYAKVKPEAAA